MIASKCPSCGSSLDIPDEYAGRTVKCGGCAQELVAEAEVPVVQISADNPIPQTPWKRDLAVVAVLMALSLSAIFFLVDRTSKSSPSPELQELTRRAEESRNVADAAVADAAYVANQTKIRKPRFDERRDEAWEAYRKGLINLAEREALLSRINDDWEKEEVKMQAAAVDHRKWEEEKQRMPRKYPEIEE